CSSGTWACLSKVKIKQGESDWVVAVIPMTQESELRAEYAALSCTSNPTMFRNGIDQAFASALRGNKMTLHGPPYPSSITLEPTPQTFVLNLLCNTKASDPEFKSYDGAQAIVEWSAPSGCNFREAPAEGGDDKPEREVEAVGSGIGWFFLLLFVVFAGYFALGAYYNYTTYVVSHNIIVIHNQLDPYCVATHLPNRARGCTQHTYILLLVVSLVRVGSSVCGSRYY
ncbi:hypothetical protein EDB84DRAFT_1277980, partial [Lactarius hengduanensis]